MHASEMEGGNVLVISIIFLFIFLYPYLIYPQILKFLSPYKSTSNEDISTKKFALFFSAYNEDAQIQTTIDWLEELKQTWPELDIWAYDDCSSDNTADLINQSNSIVLISGTSRKGKPYGIRKLIELSKADIGIFIDANVIADVQSVLNFKRYFQDRNVGSVGAKLTYLKGENVNEEVESIYWKMEEKLKELETKTGSTVGADGSMFATRLDTYPEFPADNADDFRVSMESLFVGQRCIAADDIFVFEASTTRPIDEFYRKKRIACGAIAAHRHMWSKLIKMSFTNQFKYFSHRFLRWNSAVFLWISGLCALFYIQDLDVSLYVFLCIFIVFSFFVMIPKLRRVAHKILNILLAIHAIQFGVFENILGKSYKTWQPAKSRQKGLADI